MDQERKKKRTRSDQGDEEKKAKLSKRQAEQESCRGNDNDNDSDAATTTVTAARGFDDVAAGLGVFDFPWLKDGGGVSDEYSKLEEDSFVSQLGDRNIASVTTITTPAGIEFSMPQVSCPFLEEKWHEKAEPLLRDFGFEAAESLDCIWSAFT